MTGTSTNFDYVVSFGCSLARGDELIYKNKRYASQIADKYNAKLIDCSISGTSNEIIAQTAINFLLDKKQLHSSKVLILVEWTYCNRLNFSGKNNKYYVIAQHNMDPQVRKFKLSHGHTIINFNDDFEDLMDLKFYFDHHTNPSFLLYNMARNIHHVQTFLKYNNYNYIFLFADDNEKEMIFYPNDVLNMLNFDPKIEPSIIQTKYPSFFHTIKDIDISKICPTSFVNFAHKIKCKFGIFQHPLEQGHTAFSKVLIDFIESKYGQQILHRS